MSLTKKQWDDALTQALIIDRDSMTDVLKDVKIEIEKTGTTSPMWLDSLILWYFTKPDLGYKPNFINTYNETNKYNTTLWTYILGFSTMRILYSNLDTAQPYISEFEKYQDSPMFILNYYISNYSDINANANIESLVVSMYSITSLEWLIRFRDYIKTINSYNKPSYFIGNEDDFMEYIDKIANAYDREIKEKQLFIRDTMKAEPYDIGSLEDLDNAIVKLYMIEKYKIDEELAKVKVNATLIKHEASVKQLEADAYHKAVIDGKKSTEPTTATRLF